MSVWQMELKQKVAFIGAMDLIEFADIIKLIVVMIVTFPNSFAMDHLGVCFLQIWMKSEKIKKSQGICYLAS